LEKAAEARNATVGRRTLLFASCRFQILFSQMARLPGCAEFEKTESGSDRMLGFRWWNFCARFEVTLHVHEAFQFGVGRLFFVEKNMAP